MSAGLLGGRTPSSWPSMKTRFRMGGASSFALAALAVCNGAQKGERSLAVTVSDRGLPWKNWPNSEESPFGHENCRNVWDVRGLRRSRS